MYMYIVKRQGALGGFNVKRKGGAIHRLYNMKTEGLGKAQTKEFHEKADVGNPHKVFSGGSLRSLETIKLKNSKPKKYISLNF
jgi:hypothetical protein